MSAILNDAVAGLGSEPLTEDSLERHIFPLFSRVLGGDQIYLANHSLGRPPDQTAADVLEGVRTWEQKLGDAWEDWLAEQQSFRARIAGLIHAPATDLVVPRTSAGQGLRTVLNAFTGLPRVISTRGEFDSIDVILKHYAAQGRIHLQWVEPDAQGSFHTAQLIQAVSRGADLVVVSQVMFMTGQVIEDLDALASACHAAGARLLIDAYHSVGVFPVDVTVLQADFMIGGSYKYLRGGPGACFLYISREVLDSGFAALDIGWFAKQDTFSYARPDPPLFAAGGDALLEATPPVLTWYQARAGQQFTLAMGVERLRAYGLERLSRLKGYLAEANVASDGGDSAHGAFLVVRHTQAASIATRLATMGVHTDARGVCLRLCPDCLTRDRELALAAERTARAIHELDAT